MQAYSVELICARFEGAVAIAIVESNAYPEFRILQGLVIITLAKSSPGPVYKTPGIQVEIPAAAWNTVPVLLV
jgi:hypothetical protein